MDKEKILVQIEMPPELRRRLKERAVKNRRSLRGEALSIIEERLADSERAEPPEAAHA